MNTDPNRTPPVNPEAGVLDEVHAWFVGKADREGMVYTSAVRQLMSKLYRDNAYLQKRSLQGRTSGYDFAVERDMQAIAWTVRALIQHMPAEDKQRPEPPLKARKYKRTLSPREKELYKGKPSWNGKPMRDWKGPDLPPGKQGDPPTS